MANENCLEGMRCPNCGSEGPFVIGIDTLMRFYDYGSDTHGDVIWGNRSSCSCDECRYSGIVMNFRVSEKRRYLGDGDHVEASAVDFTVTDDDSVLTDASITDETEFKYCHDKSQAWLRVRWELRTQPPCCITKNDRKILFISMNRDHITLHSALRGGLFRGPSSRVLDKGLLPGCLG